MSRVLVVDDEPSICWSLERLLRAEGHDVVTVSNAENALQLINTETIDAIILDVRLPGMSGLQAIPKIREKLGAIPIILITAFGDLETAIEAVQNEVTEYLTKPFDLDHAAEVIRDALSHQRDLDAAEPFSTSETLNRTSLVGRSEAMQDVFKRIALAARSELPVLITGESGTGKELVASAIHENSSRRTRPYVPIALPALNPSLIESELFGHVRGAFTGAVEKRDGLFTVSAGGTVLLDEIGDLPLPQQVKLLRVLEQREFTPVGEIRPRECDVRILAATNQDLQVRIAANQFREDLYFRLAVFEIKLPALRDRLDDLPLLCEYFLTKIAYANPRTAVDADAMAELRRRPWRGNVRELRNTLEHAALLARGQVITVHHLPEAQRVTVATAADQQQVTLADMVQQWLQKQLESEGQGGPQDGLFDRFMAEVEPVLLRGVIDASRGSRAAAAQKLGMHRATLREKMRRYGIELDDSP